MLEKHAREKHSSLLRKLVNYAQKSFITLGPGLAFLLSDAISVGNVFDLQLPAALACIYCFLACVKTT